VPESDSALWHAQGAGDEILTIHLVDAQPRITRYGLDGNERGLIALDGGKVVELNAEAGDPEVFVGMSSVTSPLTAYRVDLSDGSVTELTGLAPGETTWTPPTVVTERRRATSLDRTEVPYFLIHRADVDLDAPRPTLLYGYGGFHIPVLADFRATFAGWLAAGGVLAIANLRGGSEYGQEWHDAGRLAVIPVTSTEAPGKGSPFSSVTFPFTRPVAFAGLVSRMFPACSRNVMPWFPSNAERMFRRLSSVNLEAFMVFCFSFR
jgi:prolyl oligopeptidase